ncbi:hypothetical protein A5791_05935 [Mycobacterium sp. 852002-51163_SCH5372311]|nr:hypothetical protein A5791_05935 [Mycobacterium sp. 852002-51163_SCH5372311]
MPGDCGAGSDFEMSVLDPCVCQGVAAIWSRLMVWSASTDGSPHAGPTLTPWIVPFNVIASKEYDSFAGSAVPSAHFMPLGFLLFQTHLPFCKWASWLMNPVDEAIWTHPEPHGVTHHVDTVWSDEATSYLPSK